LRSPTATHISAAFTAIICSFHQKINATPPTLSKKSIGRN